MIAIAATATVVTAGTVLKIAVPAVVSLAAGGIMGAGGGIAIKKKFFDKKTGDNASVFDGMLMAADELVSDTDEAQENLKERSKKIFSAIDSLSDHSRHVISEFQTVSGNFISMAENANTSLDHAGKSIASTPEEFEALKAEFEITERKLKSIEKELFEKDRLYTIGLEELEALKEQLAYHTKNARETASELKKALETAELLQESSTGALNDKNLEIENLKTEKHSMASVIVKLKSAAENFKSKWAAAHNTVIKQASDIDSLLEQNKNLQEALDKLQEEKAEMPEKIQSVPSHPGFFKI